jgi:sarcosine oxidase
MAENLTGRDCIGYAIAMYRAIVLGLGGVGSAALYHLARRTTPVIGLDRFSPGHDQGSSHGGTRIIRQAYFEHSDYVPLVLRAYEHWHELAARQNERLFEEVGLLQIGMPDGEVIAGVRASARLHNLQLDELTPAEIMRRWPGFRAEAEQVGLFERRAGYLRVERAVIAHIEQAIAAGAQVRTGCTVRGWRAEGARVVVETDQDQLRAEALVICAGPWAGRMLADVTGGRAVLADAGVPLVVRRKPVFWFETLDDSYRAERGSPAFLYDLPGGVFYGIPQIDDAGVKVAEHTGGDVVDDASQVERVVGEADVAPVRRFVADWLPRAGACPKRSNVCLYTMSPDGQFVLDRHPAHPQVVFAAGLSGHGFKFTSVLGEALADMVIDGTSRQPVGFLGLDRFRHNVCV